MRLSQSLVFTSKIKNLPCSPAECVASYLRASFLCSLQYNVNCSYISAMPDVVFVINGVQYPVSASAYTEQVRRSEYPASKSLSLRSFIFSNGSHHFGLSHSCGGQQMDGHGPPE